MPMTFHPYLMMAGLGGGANDRVKAGRIPASGVDADTANVLT